MIQNIYAPFAFPVHMTFCIIATLFYAFLYSRKGYRHYFYLIFAIDLTLISQFLPDEKIILTLGIVELIFLILIFTSMFKVSRVAKKVEKMQNSMGNDIILDIKDDGKIIDDAFSDDDL